MVRKLSKIGKNSAGERGVMLSSGTLDTVEQTCSGSVCRGRVCLLCSCSALPLRYESSRRQYTKESVWPCSHKTLLPNTDSRPHMLRAHNLLTRILGQHDFVSLCHLLFDSSPGTVKLYANL